jgi:hypothetical protein
LQELEENKIPYKVISINFVLFLAEFVMALLFFMCASQGPLLYTSLLRHITWRGQIPGHQFYKQNNPPKISRRFLPQTLTDKIGFFVGSSFKLSPEKDIQAP